MMVETKKKGGCCSLKGAEKVDKPKRQVKRFLHWCSNWLEKNAKKKTLI